MLQKGCGKTISCHRALTFQAYGLRTSVLGHCLPWCRSGNVISYEASAHDLDELIPTLGGNFKGFGLQVERRVRIPLASGLRSFKGSAIWFLGPRLQVQTSALHVTGSSIACTSAHSYTSKREL